MELKDTVELMNSVSYVDRFVAELKQTQIRLNKLKEFLERYENNELNFKPACSLELLQEQEQCMVFYLNALYKRAEIEGIDIN